MFQAMQPIMWVGYFLTPNAKASVFYFQASGTLGKELVELETLYASPALIASPMIEASLKREASFLGGIVLPMGETALCIMLFLCLVKFLSC